MVVSHVRNLNNKLGRKLPPLHIIGYSTTKREEDVMKELQKPFHGGKFRTITASDLKDEKGPSI